MRTLVYTFILLAAFILIQSCGDGTISPSGTDDDIALLNYGEFNPDGMGNLVNDALKACQEDPACAARMDKAVGEIEIPKDTVVVADSDKIESSATEKPRSSALIVVHTSSASVSPVITSTNSSETVSSGSADISSASMTITSLDDIEVTGTCKVTTASITKGSNGSASFTKNSPTKPEGMSLIDFSNAVSQYNAAFKDFECKWKVKDETVTQACGAGTFTHTFLKPGKYDISVTIKEKEFACGSINIDGAPITGCVCKPDNYKPNVVDGAVDVLWTVTGCTTNGTITNYDWDDVDGSGETATASFTAKAQTIKPSVTVTNDDGTVKTFACDSAKAIDTSKPDYEIVKGETLEVPSGECGVATVAGNIRFEHGYDGVDCDVTLTINGTVYKNTVSYCNIYYGVLSCDGISVTAGTSICLEMTGKDGILKIKYQ